MKIRYPGERDLNGGASYTIVGGVNFVDVIFSGMNEYCADRVRKEIAELVHRYFSETQRKPGGIRTFRRAYREERASLMPEIERREETVFLKFSDHSQLRLDRGNVYALSPNLVGYNERSPYKGFTYKAEKFRDTHDEETLRAALERWGKKAS